jgi:hypothetical protein
LFNSNHCDPLLNPHKYNAYTHETATFLFVDYFTAVYLFTKRYEALKSDAIFTRQREVEDDDYKIAQQEADETLAERLEAFQKSQGNRKRRQYSPR